MIETFDEVEKVEEKSNTFGLDPDKMADLLRIGFETGGSAADVSADEEKGELLLDRLAEPLLLDPSFVRLLPDVPHLLSNAMELCSGNTIGDLLLNKDVEVGLLKKVKDLNNKFSRRTDSKVEKDVAIAIYYAAIASVLVFHGQKITGFEYSDLEKSFEQLKGKSWMSTDLRDLFKRACEVCRDSSGIRNNVAESQELPGKV
jgi:hypothetical protein